MPLNVLAKFSILDICGGSGYASEDVLKNEIFTTTVGSSKTGNSEKIMKHYFENNKQSQSIKLLPILLIFHRWIQLQWVSNSSTYRGNDDLLTAFMQLIQFELIK